MRSLVSGYEGMFILADVLQKSTRQPLSDIFAILANFCCSSIGFRLFTLSITCEALSPALPKLRSCHACYCTFLVDICTVDGNCTDIDKRLPNLLNCSWLWRITTETSRPRFQRSAWQLILSPNVNDSGQMALFVTKTLWPKRWTHSVHELLVGQR